MGIRTRKPQKELTVNDLAFPWSSACGECDHMGGH